MLLILYNPGTRLGLVQELRLMQCYLIVCLYTHQEMRFGHITCISECYPACWIWPELQSEPCKMENRLHRYGLW